MALCRAVPLQDLAGRAAQPGQPGEHGAQRGGVATRLGGQHDGAGAVTEERDVDHLGRWQAAQVEFQVVVFGDHVTTEDEGGAVPAGEQHLAGDVERLEGAGAPGLELVGGDTVDAEPVGDHVHGGGHQVVRGRRAHHHEVDVLGGEAGGLQRLPAGGLAQVGQRVANLAGVQVDREMAGAGADEGVDPLLPDRVHPEATGQGGVVDGRAGQRRADGGEVDIGRGHRVPPGLRHSRSCYGTAGSRTVGAVLAPSGSGTRAARDGVGVRGAEPAGERRAQARLVGRVAVLCHPRHLPVRPDEDGRQPRELVAGAPVGGCRVGGLLEPGGDGVDPVGPAGAEPARREACAEARAEARVEVRTEARTGVRAEIEEHPAGRVQQA